MISDEGMTEEMNGNSNSSHRVTIKKYENSILENPEIYILDDVSFEDEKNLDDPLDGLTDNEIYTLINATFDDREGNITVDSDKKDFFYENGFINTMPENKLFVSVEANEHGSRKYSKSFTGDIGVCQFNRVYTNTPDELKRYHTHFVDKYIMKFIIDVDYICGKLTKNKIEIMLGEIYNKLEIYIRAKTNDPNFKLSGNLYDSSRKIGTKTKISYHYLFHGFYFTDISIGKQLTRWLIDELNRSENGSGDYHNLANNIDKNIYKNNGSIRFYNCHKFGDPNSTKKLIQNHKGEKIEEWRYHFPSHVAINGEICIDKYYNKKTKIDNKELEKLEQIESEICETAGIEQLDKLLEQSFDLLPDKDNWRFVKSESTGFLKLSHRIKCNNRYNCSCCDKKDADQNHILYFSINKNRWKKTAKKNDSLVSDTDNDVSTKDKMNKNDGDDDNDDHDHINANDNDEINDNSSEDIESIKKGNNLCVYRKCFHGMCKPILVMKTDIMVDKKTMKIYNELEKKKRDLKLTNLIESNRDLYLPLSIPADELVNEPYFKSNEQNPTFEHQCILIHSEPGTAKTTFIHKAIKDKDSAIVLSNRISYAHFVDSGYSSLGFKNYLKKDVKNLLGSDPPNRLIISPQSFWKLNLSLCNYDIVIFDESEALLDVFNNSTLYNSVIADSIASESNDKKNPSLVYKHAMDCINGILYVLQNCKHAFVMDGFMTRKTFDFCELLFGREQMFYYRNEYKNMQFHCREYKHLGKFENAIYYMLKSGRNLNIPCNINSYIKDLVDRILILFPDLHDKILIVNKDVNTAEEINLLLDPAKITNYRILIYSPKLLNGVSIDVKNHFDLTFLYADSNSCCVRDVCQMLKRVRHPKTSLLCYYITPTVRHSPILNYSDIYNTLIKSYLHTQHIFTQSFLPNISILPACIISSIINSTLEKNYSRASFSTVFHSYMVYLGMLSHNIDDIPHDRINLSKKRVDEKKEQKTRDANNHTEYILSNIDIPSDQLDNISKLIKDNSKNIKRPIFDGQIFLKHLPQILSVSPPEFLSFMYDKCVLFDLERDPDIFYFLKNNHHIRQSIISDKLLSITTRNNCVPLINFNNESRFLDRLAFLSNNPLFLSCIYNDNIFSTSLKIISNLVMLYNKHPPDKLNIHLCVYRWCNILGIDILSIDTCSFNRDSFSRISPEDYDCLYEISFINNKSIRPKHGFTDNNKLSLFTSVIKYYYNYNVNSERKSVRDENSSISHSYNITFSSSICPIQFFSLIKNTFLLRNIHTSSLIDVPF